MTGIVFSPNSGHFLGHCSILGVDHLVIYLIKLFDSLDDLLAKIFIGGLIAGM